MRTSEAHEDDQDEVPASGRLGLARCQGLGGVAANDATCASMLAGRVSPADRALVEHLVEAFLAGLPG